MNLMEIEQHLRTKIKGMDREGFGALIERLYKMYDRTHKEPYYARGGRANLELLEDSDFFDNGLFKAMQESADAVKSAPKYDFSCVTPLMEDSVLKKGKWSNKFKSDPSSIFGTTLISVCSNCNKENSIGWTKYCPHCGAEMENGEE